MPRLHIQRPMHIENWVLETNSPEFARHMELFYGDCVSPANDTEQANITVIEDATGAIITHPEGQSQTDDALMFFSDYFFEHTQIEEGFFAMHAGAVGYNGRAYVFAASTTSGKTTLTAYLTGSGFSYITDDCVLIEKESLMTHPFAKPVHLRDGGMEVLGQYGIVPETVRIERNRVSRFIWRPENEQKEPIPLGGIFFIERCGEHSCERLGQSESINMLMQSPITHFKICPEYLHFLKKLSGVGCYRLKYADMAYMAALLKEGMAY